MRPTLEWLLLVVVTALAVVGMLWVGDVIRGW